MDLFLREGVGKWIPLRFYVYFSKIPKPISFPMNVKTIWQNTFLKKISGNKMALLAFFLIFS